MDLTVEVAIAFGKTRDAESARLRQMASTSLTDLFVTDTRYDNGVLQMRTDVVNDHSLSVVENPALQGDDIEVIYESRYSYDNGATINDNVGSTFVHGSPTLLPAPRET